MDFLDPRRKKAHRRRLVLGYALMSILIGVGTLILLYVAYGYDVNRETGQLIQNGIVFVDSKPQGASVYLNDQLQPRTTDTRLDIPTGTYTIRLENEGYRHWERTFSIDGGGFQRLVYPLLIPNVLVTEDITAYDALPQLTTQSPDRRWLFVQKPGQTYQFDMFDLNDQDVPSETVQIPVGILTEPSADATLEFVEWSTDNRHVLMKRTYNKANEFIMFDRENPDESINLNKDLGISPVRASLKNKRPDQVYFMESKPGLLRVANIRDRTISAPLLSSVADYSTYGDNIILYVTTEDTPKGKAQFRILEDDQDYLLKQASSSDQYVLDVSRYDNRWYYVAGSAADNITFVYDDPLAALKSRPAKSLAVKAVIRMDDPRFTSFSANTQFIVVQSGSAFTVLDLEFNKQYYTELKHDIPKSQKLRWMDGHRLLYVVNGQSYIIDFDGSNEETLVTSLGELPYFDRDYDNVFTLEGSKSEPSKQALTITQININQ